MYFELPDELEELWKIIEPYKTACYNGEPVPDEIAEANKKFQEGFSELMEGVM